MPAKSKAQFKAMKAAAAGDSRLGIAPKVGREFTEGQSMKNLPDRITSAPTQSFAGKRKKAQKGFPYSDRG